jgi:NAD(P)-dependent dehydrogenase (short-subunit alcohol dehydrogenase family)
MVGREGIKMVRKRYVVAGGFGFLGQAVCSTLRRQGADVVVVDRGAARETGTLDVGGVDLSNMEEAQLAIGLAAERLDGLDGVANLVGAFRWETIQDANSSTWDDLFSINVKTALCASKAAVPFLLERGGGIVNVGAGAAVKSTTGMGAYAAAKSGVARLTEALAEELKATGVRVNAVCPSIIDTPRNRQDMPDEDFSKWVSPDALAEAIAFLLSDSARAITGALVPVYGQV